MDEILLNKLVGIGETEWIEFKVNHSKGETIGKYISALSNGSQLFNQQFGYLIFGVNDEKEFVGTEFNPKWKKGNENFETWLVKRLNPKIDFRIHKLVIDNKPLVVFVIPAANGMPTRFMGNSYCRISSDLKDLEHYPERERKLWTSNNDVPFEIQSAEDNLTFPQIEQLIDIDCYYRKIGAERPSRNEAVIKDFIKEHFLYRMSESKYSITNLCALLFAKNLSRFHTLNRKAPRVIGYKGTNKLESSFDQIGGYGYAESFEKLVMYIFQKLPGEEKLLNGIRQYHLPYPDVAVRELIANALVHQDFSQKGKEVTIEVFVDRIEVTNPGNPVVKTDRFIDEFQSRNEKLADFMYKIGICENRGSGVDKIVNSAEEYDLPAPSFHESPYRMTCTLYAFKKFANLSKEDKVRAAFQHACLKYINKQEMMTNTSLRERFKVDKNNSSQISKIIEWTMGKGLIKPEETDSKSRKYAKYVPYWA